MKTISMNRPSWMAVSILALGAVLALNGCGHRAEPRVETAAVRPTISDPLAIALAPHTGEARIDERIRRGQEQVRIAVNPSAVIEQLGWLFVAKARESFDPGFYTLAEQCALALDARQPASAEALLLRGHALQSQHRFGEAETLARQLVARRGLAFDHGLLGDILVDVGRVDEAARAYQKMLDLKPDPRGYARAAHIRWLKGDLEGAVEITRLAVAGASRRDAESAAWMHTQLARYLWQSGQGEEASGALRVALAFQTNYPPALLLRGRMLLSEGRNEDAIEPLRQAARINPLPEYQWALSEALRAGGREDEARSVETLLVSRGAATDPRTCSLYLATCRTDSEMAVRLARKELTERADVFTHDALAWALAAAGKVEEAQVHLRLALVQGTKDARLCLHAAVIMARLGQIDEARDWIDQAARLKSQLLPSETAELQSVEKLLTRPSDARVAPADATVPKPFPSGAGVGAETEN